MCFGGGEKKQQQKKRGLQIQNNQNQSIKKMKICIIGNMAVGKTSITFRYVNNNFSENYLSTIGGQFIEKAYISKKKETLKLNIWDTTGEEKLRNLMNLYYNDANAIILVYDINDKQTFLDLGYWIEEIRSKAKDPNINIKLVGNKIDTPKENHQVSQELINNFKQEHNLQGDFFCSARTGAGIEQIFSEIAEQFLEQK